MPYIKPEDRKLYEPELTGLCRKLNPDSKGDLTYLTYALALARVEKLGRGYTNISESIGALIDAAEELRRRELFDYEDKKIRENGDVIIAEDGSVVYD